MLIQWMIDNLRRTGKSERSLARYLGLAPSAITKIKSKERQIKGNELVRMAEFFGTEPPSTTKGEKILPVVHVPVVGIISAGVWREANTVAALLDAHTVDLPAEMAGKEAYALLVEGTSINKTIPGGMYAICRPYWELRAEIRDGDLVHVERERAGMIETTLKRVRIIGGVVELHPESTDQAFQAKVALADHPDVDSVEVKGLVVGAFQKFDIR